MSYTSARFIRHFGLSSAFAYSTRDIGCLLLTPTKRKFCSASIPIAQKASEELLVVVGGGAAGFFGAIRAKTLAPKLNVVVIEKGKPLSKVKISGGGRCNVTNGHFVDNMILAENYPRGYKEFRGSFFDMHGPVDTMSWFSDHGVDLKVEEDGRVFPVSNSSASVIDCLMSEANRTGVVLQTGKAVRTASADGGKFLLGIGKQTTSSVEYVEANYLLIASGNSSQVGFSLASQLGHSIIDPVPSLFTFKTADSQLAELSGVTFPKVRAKLILENVKRNIQQFTQVGPMLVTHWGLSGPVILRLSAWGARDLFSSGYKGTVTVDFIPDLHIEDVKSILSRHKHQFVKQKVSNAYPPEFGLVKRFWKYILDRQGVSGDALWASIPNNTISSVASLLKHCDFGVTGKGQFKDEFVKAGGVPLSEISLNTMESKLHSDLFFAGEVLNVDGVTGGFNFQNAWSGGYRAGTTIGTRVRDAYLRGLDIQ
ncbi:FAD/NAD(P)-binding oxidoreductase family protein [Trema orientale]|uniref:FAD/NAD(P)-binding oxidoreductase family protein n=1 Tax=Trema orientale TaxID=63057 RepID=A0A2P5FDM2_TREOI|nr:FAD/NAD(P)-binding oxidoreductase family protein [Trema orientale]